MPRWTKDSSEAYYLTAARAVSVAPVHDRNGLPDPGAETVVIQASEDLAEFDVTPDGERLLVRRRNEGQIRPVSHLIVGWEHLVEKRAR